MVVGYPTNAVTVGYPTNAVTEGYPTNAVAVVYPNGQHRGCGLRTPWLWATLTANTGAVGYPTNTETVGYPTYVAVVVSLSMERRLFVVVAVALGLQHSFTTSKKKRRAGL